MAERKLKPKIRFKGYIDDWEKRKLGDLISYIVDNRGKNPKYYCNEGIPVIDNFMIKNNCYPNIKEATRFIDDYLFDNFVRKYNEVDDILITLVGNGIGNITLFPREKSVIIQNTLGLRFCNGKKFMFYSLLSKNKQIISLDRGMAQPSIRQDELLDIDLELPSDIEQTKISELFYNLDSLITLHQRKYDKLINVKKSMLEKMFPKNGASVPQIRFKGFTDDWEQRKFSDVFVTLQNNSLSRAELNYEYGVAMNVHYGDVLIKFGEVLDINKEEIPYITDESFASNNSASFLHNGDVIIADAAEDETVGKCSEIAGLSNEIVVSGLHTIPCRPVQPFASGYLGYYMNSRVFHNQLLPLMQGTKISSISKSAMRDTNIIYPKSDAEQRTIGQFFISLDNLITFHQRKLEKLKTIKKSMLEKMFL